MDDYQTFIHKSKYARFDDVKKRREDWGETIDRYLNFFHDKFSEDVEKLEFSPIWKQLRTAIYNQEVMPSMRAMMCAGRALERDNVAGYNCAYRAIDDTRAFDEVMYVLLCGTGVGFSVERQYISNLPEIAEEFHESDTTIVVKDSKIGWASAYRELVSLLYGGKIPKWDVSKIRPKGARLKTFGGRASGPEPLEDLFRFTIGVFKNAKGRKLQSLEAHDVVCKVADIVVVGGVRRSALLSLSNLTDERMRKAKSGEWYIINRQRELANNSVCYTELPDMGIFMKEWHSLYESKSGERGIFSRPAAKRIAGRNGRRDTEHEFGTNPCSEIILRSRQFCNLSEIVVRADDTLDQLLRKAELASILGTFQATLTKFRYLSRKWKTNTEEERLLGVSLTGIMDHAVLGGSNQCGPEADINALIPYPRTALWLRLIKEKVLETNAKWAKRLGIEAATAATCVKPSGTVSQLVNSASGIHCRFSPYYIRTVRSDKKDPIYAFMKAQGVPCADVIGNESNMAIFSFPIKAPEGATVTKDVSAIEQLELWEVYQEHWCEHKPSITVYVKEHEWLEVGAWVHKHMPILSGVSFLPHDDHIYPQAPYTEITHDEYEAAVQAFPKDIDWDALAAYETEDNTSVGHELACSAGGCELP